MKSPTSPFNLLIRRRLQRTVKERGAHSKTTNQDISLTQQRNALRTRLRHWQVLQALYMPGLAQFQRGQAAITTSNTIPRDTHPNIEDEDLFLPSSLPAFRRVSICIPTLVEIEEQLRTAQCYDALDGIRHTLHVKSHMVIFKNKNIRGQYSGTRSRAVIDRVHERARAFAQKYRMARMAKLTLSGPGAWEEVLRPLNDADIRCYSDPDKLARGPGRRGTVEDDVAMPEPAIMPGNPDDDGIDIDLLPEQRSVRDGTGETR